MKKNLLILFTFFILNNCTLSGTALLGPVYTGVTTGSAYQTSISYGTGKFLKKIKEEKDVKVIPQENISNHSLKTRL